MTHRVLLIIGGGIAAFKSLLLIRELARRGVETQVILTKGGTEFVTPLSAGALSGKTVFTDLWELDEQADMGHIELSRSADLIVVAPATANLISRAAHGVADDLATTTLLATDTRVLYAPAMNVRMWEAAATQRNVKRLAEDGALFIGPDVGDMACGEHGPGRMAEPDAIADAVQGALMGDMSLDGLRGKKPLSGRHAVVTAGPTREAIDPVRYISNHSSGLQGYAIAQALYLYLSPPSRIGVPRLNMTKKHQNQNTVCLPWRWSKIQTFSQQFVTQNCDPNSALVLLHKRMTSWDWPAQNAFEKDVTGLSPMMCRATLWVGIIMRSHLLQSVTKKIGPARISGPSHENLPRRLDISIGTTSHEASL